jgi:hypothetical protein
MKTALSAVSFVFRALLYLVSFGWNVVLPFVGLRPHIDRGRAIMIGLGLAFVWAYWIAIAIAR